MRDPSSDAAELKLIIGAQTGVELDCATLPPPRTDDNWHHVRAQVISQLLEGQYGPLHPRGVSLRNARIISDGHEPLRLESLRLPVGLKLERCLLDCPIIAHDARMPWLELNDCYLPFLLADRIKVAGTVYLRGLITSESCDMGAVRLVGAHIGGNLELDGAQLDNPGGPALHAEGLRVDRALRFRNGKAIVNCDTGAVQLVNARVRGDVWLDNTKIENKDGPVLNAEGIRVAGSLLVCSGFEAKATSSELATIHLMSARIGSRLDLGNGREFTGMSHGPADRVRTPAVIENGHESRLVLDLRCVTVNELRLLPETICEPTDLGCSQHNKVVLGGLKYSTLSLESTHSHWPHWFSRHAEPFEAEPYQHLASIMRDTGRATEAKEILIELENERYRGNEAKTTRSQLWHWVKRAFIGHGYKPGRALVGLLCVVGFAMIVTTLANLFGWISRPALLVQGIDPGEAVRLQCSPGDAIRLAADLSVPLINTSGRLRCDFGHEGIAANLGTVLGIALQVFGWAFATLFVAGFSGVVRKI